jgi:hypothetical protein
VPLPSRSSSNFTLPPINQLNSACITALSNAQYGILVLPAAIQLSQALAKLAMMLDKRPDLTLRLRQVTNTGSDERKSLVEGTAECIQRAFTMCLSERTANRNGISRDGTPESKKVGIYSFANLVLKLLFQVSHYHRAAFISNLNNSVGKQDWRISSLRTYPSNHHLYASTLPVNESHTFTILAAFSSRVVTSTAHSCVFNPHMTNAMRNA